MRKVSLAGALMIATTTHVVNAQNIPATIPQAEAEGAGFLHNDSLSARQPYFAESPFGGTSERRCVSDSLPDLSLRSGDFIVRGRVFLPSVKHKVLWIPLHGSPLSKPPLVIRAARMESPADSVRLRVEGVARGVFRDGPLYGYPSEVLFPIAGRWLVVATAGGDWGCFVLDVKPRARTN